VTYQAVIFDFFGTLTSAFRRGPRHDQVARALGCDPQAYTELLTRSYDQRVRGAYGGLTTTLRWLARELGRDPSPEQLEEASWLRVAAIREDIVLREDAVDVLAALREDGLRTAVVSDCAHEVPMIMPELPIHELLDAAVYSVLLGVAKPHPSMFTTASRLLGVPVEACLYVGDGGGCELSGARAVGMNPVRLVTADLAHHLVFNPDPDSAAPVVASLTEVIPLALRPADGLVGAAWAGVCL
jgi:putative hydrolase of the HAD superfamily